MTVAISTVLLHRILAHAAEDPAVEACGLLLGDAGRIVAAPRVANVSPTPATRFEIDPARLFAAHRAARTGAAPALLGHYHSHPNGLPTPSPRDAAAALDPGTLWLIVAGGVGRLWRTEAPGRLVAWPLRIVP